MMKTLNSVSSSFQIIRIRRAMDILELIRMRDLRRIFQNKYVVFMGDSNMRSIYKDFILLLQEDRLMTDAERKAGGNKESICGSSSNATNVLADRCICR